MTTTATTTGSTSATSKSSLGASIVGSLNAGSGIDTDGLVTKLTAAQKAALEDGITARQTANAAQISAAGSLASDMTSFSSSLATLISGGTLMTQPVSSNATVAGAVAQAGSRIGNLAATLSVSALAKAQTIESQPIDPRASFASGSVSITTAGGAAISLVAGRDFSDLASLVSAINAGTATTGITAGTVADGSGTHLVLKGATGTAKAFSVAADGDAAGFAYDPQADGGAAADVATGQGMQRLQAAQDAAFTIDGVAYTRGTNSVTDALAGVTLTLAAPGTTTLTAKRPGDAIAQAVSDFVAAYNTLKSEIVTATAAATASTDAGALRGNQTIRDMQRRLAQITTTPLIASGSVTTLAEVGVRTGQDGTLSVDTTMLNKMVAAYPDDVEAMFNPAQSSSSASVSITSKLGTVAAGVYSLSGLTPARNGAAAQGSIDGVAASGSGATLTAAAGSPAAGLSLTLSADAPSSATLRVDLGLGGALALVTQALAGAKGSITSLQSRLKTQASTLADQLADAEKKLTVYHDRLVTQFSAMNTRVSSYKATQSYLTQQIDLWTKSSD